MSQLSGMAAGGLELRSDEDPWKISTFISAFTDLLLSVIVLLGVAIAFITSQIVKYFGLEPPCSYIGCSHPGRSEVSRRRKYPIPSSCGNEFSVNDVCPDCDLSRFCPKCSYKNFILTDSHHHEDASQTLEDEDSSSRDHNALVDEVLGCQNIELKRRKTRARKKALNNLPNSYLVCSHCNHPPSNSVNQHNFMKKAVDKGRDAHCQPYVYVDDDGGVGAVSRKAFTEDDLPLFSAKPVFADGNSCDLEDDSESSSISGESMKDIRLEKKGRRWTGFSCILEETPRNISVPTLRDREGDLHSCLLSDTIDSSVQKVDKSRPFCGFEREIVRRVSSCDNCPYVNGEELKGAEVSANNKDRFVNAGDALYEEPVALFQPEGNVHEMMRKTNNEFVLKRSSQTESTEERRVLIAENIKAALQKQGKVAVLECLEDGSPREHTFGEVVDVGTKHLDCLEKGQAGCEQEHIFELGQDTDLADSGDSFSIKALGRISVSNQGENAEGWKELDARYLTQCEDIVGKVKKSTTLENAWEAFQLIDSVGEVALEGSEDFQKGKNVKVDLEGLLNSRQLQKVIEEAALKGHLHSCDLQEADILEGRTEGSMVTSEPDSEQNLLHADHSNAPQQEERSEVVKLGELEQEGDGWFWDLSKQEQFLSVSDLGFCLTGILEKCQEDARSEQENGLPESGGCSILETRRRPTSTQLSRRKPVIKYHLDGQEREQTVGGLDVQQGEVEFEPHFSESEPQPEPEIDSNDWNEGDVYVLKGAESRLLNVAPEASDLHNISGKHGSSVGEKASPQEGVTALADRSHHEKCMDPIRESNQCPFKDDGFRVKDLEAVPAVSREVDPDKVRISEIGFRLLDGVQPGSEEKKSIVTEQQEAFNSDNSGNIELTNRQFIVPESDVPGNVVVGEEVDDMIEGLGLDAYKNIERISAKNFAMSPCIDDTEDREQKLGQILEPEQESPPQGHPCKHQEEEDLVLQGNHEEDSSSQSDREDGLDALKEALQIERSALAALEIELEKERNAAAIAASEAMAMISRLQEEKSAMQIEVAQFQRMSEEKAEYDQQAMSLLKEILFKREKEKFALEKEVELYRARLVAEKVDTNKINRMVKEKFDLPMQATKPIEPPKRCDHGASASSSSEQILGKCGSDGGLALETMKDLDNVEQKRSKRLRGMPVNNCDAREDWGLQLDISEAPIERAFDFQHPFLESSFSKSNQSLFKTQGTQQMQEGCEDILEMGRYVFSTDDEETQFILERLWVLEEELQELRGQSLGQEEVQDCTPVNGNSDCLIEVSYANSEDSNEHFLKKVPKTAFQSGTERTDMGPMHVDSSSLPDLVKSSRHRDNSAQHVDGTVPRGQDEETGMGGDGVAAGGFLPVLDIYEVEPVSKQYRRHPLNFEGSEYADNLRDQLQKTDWSPGDMSQELVCSAVESKEMGPRRVPWVRKLFCPNGAMVQSNGRIVKDSPYADSSWEQDLPDLHMKTKTVIRDERQTPTETDFRQLTMRLKALEADRELLKQTSQSFQQKDTGFNLLQEIVEHLRELRKMDSQRTVAVNLPQGVDPHWTTSAESRIPAVKKRRH